MLVVVVIALAAGLAAGALAGGTLRGLGEVRLSHAPLALSALGIMVVESVVDLGDAPDRALVGLGYALAAAFIAVNARRLRGTLRAGLAAIGTGWALNALVMLANGGMPLSLHAYAASGQTAAPTPGTGGFFKIVVADGGTLLRPLGDVIPLRALHQVVSAGDLALLAGLAFTVAAAMRTAVRERRPARSAAGKPVRPLAGS